jgi:autotransporter-associated beta strand protein
MTLRKKQHLLTAFRLLVFLYLHSLGILRINAQFTFSDEASNYSSSSWGNSSNNGTGFNAWAISTGGVNSGTFIGDPAAYGMGTSNITSTAFGLYGHTSQYVNAVRYFGRAGTDIGMQVGDVFSFYWSMNWDCGSSGSKGFDFRSGMTVIFNVNNANSSTITTSNGNANTNYGTAAMLVTLTRSSSSQYTFEMTSRSGGSPYTTTINSNAEINNINIYCGSQENSAGQRNIFFNKFTYSKAHNPYVIGAHLTEPRILTGSSSLTKTGNFNLTLSASNTYTGSTTINEGMLIIGSDNALGSAPGSATPSHLTIGNGSLGISSSLTLNTNRGVTINNNSSTLDVFGGSTLTYNGIIAGSGAHQLNKIAAGTLVLGGANTYSGNTLIGAGTLRLVTSSSSSASGPLGTAAGGTTVSSGAVLDLNGNSLSGSATESLTLNGTGISNGGALINSGSSPSTLDGAINLNSGTRITASTGNILLNGNITGGSNTLYIGGNNNTFINGTINGSGGISDGSLFKDGNGSLTLSGANTYSGNTVLTSGYLYLGTGNTGSVGSITNSPIGTGSLIFNGGALASDGANARTVLNPITLGGNFTLGHATNNGTLTLSATGTLTGNQQINVLSPVNYSGKITGNFSLTKLGSGTLTLSNTTNDFTGGLAISEGTVSASDANNFGSGAITLGNATNTTATLNITASLSRSNLSILDLSTAGLVNVASGQTFTISALGGGSNNDTRFGKTGSGTLALSGAGTFNGQLMISDGTVIISNNAGVGTNQSIIKRGIDLGLSVTTAPQPNNVSILVANGVTVPQSVYVAANTSNATRTIGLSGSGSAAFSNEIFLDGDLTVAAGNANTITFTAPVIDDFGLIVTSGTTVLTGANTYTGLTTISGGTLQLARSGGSTLPAGNNLVINSGNLRISENQTLNNLTATSGTITVDAGKTLTINGKLTIGSGVTINLNTTGLIVYGANADLEFTNSVTISDAMWPSGSGPTDVIINGSGITVSLDKARTVPGTLNLTDGVLDIGNYNLTLSGSIIGGSSTAYINTGGTGKIIRSLNAAALYSFPVGNGAYSPINLNFISGTFSSATASVRVAASKHPSNISATSFINRYWEVNQTGITSFNCNVSCTYQQSDVTGSEGSIYAGKYNGSVWSMGSITDVGNNVLTFNGATSFSDFTGGELSAMPVHWLFNRCQALPGKINLSWGVSEEPATGFYSIERSPEGHSWKSIGTKTPAGISFTSTIYSFTDAAPLTENYYRIKYTEKNGDFQYSEICFAQQSPKEKPLIRMDAAGSEISVSYAHHTDHSGNITLYDMSGRKLKAVHISGKTTYMNTTGLPPGVYELLIDWPGYRHSERLMLTNP